MKSSEIISLVVTIVGIFSFAGIFTILYLSYSKLQIAEIESGKKDIEIIDEVIYEKQEKIKKRKKITGLIRNVVFYLILILVIPLFIFSLISRFKGNVMMIGNKSVLVVASGSMSFKNEANKYLENNNPDSKLNFQFQTYDIIIIEKVDSPSQLSQYDVIAFKNSDGINVIHRIKNIENGTYETRGDANDASDKYHPEFKDIIGRYSGKKINGLGMFVMFLQSSAGIVTIISLIYCLFVIDYLAEKINKAQKERLKKLEAVIDYSDEVELNKFKVQYVETIYYKGYAYKFNENGFIDKTECKDEPYLEKSNETIIEDKNIGSTSKEEIVVDNDETGE